MKRLTSNTLSAFDECRAGGAQVRQRLRNQAVIFTCQLGVSHRDGIFELAQTWRRGWGNVSEHRPTIGTHNPDGWPIRQSAAKTRRNQGYSEDSLLARDEDCLRAFALDLRGNRSAELARRLRRAGTTERTVKVGRGSDPGRTVRENERHRDLGDVLRRPTGVAEVEREWLVQSHY